MNYEQAQQQYKKAKTFNGEKRKKLSNHTYLLQDGEDYCVKLHDTIIIRIRPDNSIILNSNGWQTPTTKERINNFTPTGIGISQQDKVWYLDDGNEFFDGIIIASDGTVINPLPKSTTAELDKKRKRLSKMINAYIKGFWMAVKAGQIEYPNGGDCWHCCMRTEDGKTWGDSFNDMSHLVSHLEEHYYVSSLLYNAFRESHQNPDFAFQYTIESKSDWNVRTTLRRYFKVRFNALLELI